MGRTMILVMACGTALAAHAATTVHQDGPTAWSIENDLIRVELQAQTGAVSVLDKRIGYHWHSASRPEMEVPDIALPRLGATPAVDGDLREWPAAPSFELTPDMVADARAVDGNADLSARVWQGWDATALYLAADVSDDRLRWPQPGATEWWQADSVELWVGGLQVALLPGAAGWATWTRSGPLAGAQVAMQARGDGYAVEAALPWEALGVDHALGDQIRFALGVNDADDDTGRQGQLYFPRTWTHSQPETFARAWLTDAAGALPETPQAAGPVCRDVAADARGLRYQTDLRDEGGPDLPATVTLTVPDTEPDLIVTIDLPVDTPVRLLTGPVLLPMPTNNAEILAARYSNGVAIPVTDMSFKGQRLSTYSTLDMPWVGLSDGGAGYLLLYETPDDGTIRFEPCPTSGETLLAPLAQHEPCRGVFGYPRVVRYGFTDAGGHVSICKRYRRYAQEHGLLVTLREKAERVPAVAGLIGAPDVWGASSSWAFEAHAAGIERCLVNGRFAPEEMRRIIELGYVLSEYDNYVDLLDGERGENGTLGPLAEDVRMDAAGEMVKGWLTWNKDKQYYKRCSATATDAARREVPAVLAQYPYNARFLDVTTASGLRECYHPSHPLTRTQDREASVALAEYVKSQGLALGGEHGRWWGAHVFDYWEGMQSGGNYSWPAGHVGIEIPQTREEIGERYWVWGIGHQRRVPLWELVFGDCVVSTWYWGDSTGHLYQAAPDIADKQDAFNVLYGTVPLYWVNRPYGLNWNTLRERLLRSYRNVCRLHEQTGWDEMLSHEYVTPDREVQRTRFSSGTTVTVNFGAAPFEVQGESGQYRLPQYGFLAEGPSVLEYLALDGPRQVTFIRTPGYLFCDGGGEEHDFGAVVCAGQVEVRGPEDEAALRIRCSGGPARLRLPQVAPEAPTREGDLRLFTLDGEGQRTGYEPLEIRDRVLALATADGWLELSWGRSIAAPDLELRALDLPADGVRQGEPLPVTVRVTNRGGASADGALVLRLGEQEVGREPLTLAAGRSTEVKFSVDTSRLDGARTLSAEIKTGPDDMISANNRAPAEAMVHPDLSLWARRVPARVTNDAQERTDALVSAEVDFGEGGVDPDSVRVLEMGADQRMVRAQLDEGRVWWIMPGVTPAGAERSFAILSDPAEPGGRHLPPDRSMWDDREQAVTTPSYRAEIREGAIAAVYSHLGVPDRSIFTGIVASSKETGWVREVGEVTDVRVLARGPVRVVVETDKTLAGDRHCTRRYEFYLRHFVIRATTDAGMGCLTRAYYGLGGAYADESGGAAVIDGKGDGEGVIGRDTRPRWYAVYADDWAHSAVSLRDDVGGITYWDSGAWGGVCMNAGGARISEIAYVLHGGQSDASFAQRDFELLRSSPTVTLGE